MEQRNLLIAIVLSVGILIAFQFAFERMRPPQPAGPSPAGPSGGTAVTGPSTTGPASESAPPSPAASASSTGATAPGAAPTHAFETRDAALSEQPRVKIAT